MTSSRITQSEKNDVVGCPQCDWVSRLVSLSGNERAECPRCGYVLEHGRRTEHFTLVAIATSALVMLLASLSVDFIRYSAAGVEQSMTLLDTAWQLSYFHEKVLAVLVLLTVILIPFIYLVSLIWVYSHAKNAARNRSSLYLLRLTEHLKPWLMTDVFLLGTLVALVKISSLADIRLLEGFWSFSAFVVLLLFVYERVKQTPVWRHLIKTSQSAPDGQPGMTAFEQGLQTCPVCYALNSQNADTCYQCTEPQKTSWWRRPGTTVALITAGAIMLIPAHWLPVMETVRFGSDQPSTIIGGVTELWQSGDKPIAAIVFVASLVIPVAKVLVLITLLILARWQTPQTVRHRLILFKLTDWIGRWSMIDIFVVAILVALVRSGSVMSVYPGSAAVSFAAAVVLTMLAAMSFDTRLFWREADK
ncbi:PqiA/YebS family transporter subunit [Idiomarina loihiensis]|uniref:PqiA/YebS family transporter subunit n=2 Tax=Idiomarinaceae TaxID=267893 RepID=UPI000C0E321A|nr:MULTISPECIES: PqiA/YebS family transporter subunit [Idiomarina]MBL4855637.1 PqiA/YebS family transporter subunit [Idiomarina sp.]PHQ91862.1 MAG: paraquat-inducible protein [Idiomarina sp.]PWW41580.1 paraquat-inducible protein A [Idiomarina loihiensis]TDP50638.1 paraquat-inducible protein A [Idiomarina loihiensis]TDS25084.1 paraquat-inducible protein A [Idiomarina sp. H2]